MVFRHMSRFGRVGGAGLLMVLLATVGGMAGGARAQTGTTAPQQATAVLRGIYGQQLGTATFTSVEGGVKIRVVLQGFAPGRGGDRGLHIHEQGLCEGPDFRSAGPHFNPTGAVHGLANPQGPHAGDLPNIQLYPDGTALYETTTDRVTLGSGERSLFDSDGSTLVVTAGPDDQTTDPGGRSGDRIACGVIVMGGAASPPMATAASTPAAPQATMPATAAATQAAPATMQATTMAVQPQSARAVFQNINGYTMGTASFTTTSDGKVHIRVEVSGFDPGESDHGIHIHEVGKCEPPSFSSAGGHFNPTTASHGLADPRGPHAGDLPMIHFAANGSAVYETTTDRVTLGSGAHSLFDADGNALMIHAGSDDQRSDPSGNSGNPIACGVILPETATMPSPMASTTPMPAPMMSPTPTTGATSSTGVGLQLVAEGLSAPVAMGAPNDRSGRLLIADQIGVIRVVMGNGQMAETPFLDLRSRMVTLSERYDERGLLGLALHPDFQSNGRFYVYYSAPLQAGAPQDWNHTSHISEFKVLPTNPNQADPASERVLLRVNQPQGNHNGGQIAFGPDGYLYIPLGDGGAANDVGTGHPPQGNGQDRSTLLGSILRIDVNRGDPYGIPTDNPFVNDPAPDEIFAYGFRNPYRIAFDAGGNRALYVGDAGQDLYEEVSIVEKGNNYGWRIREATHCFSPEQPKNPPAQCATVGSDGKPLVGPIIEYSHDLGLVVVGGNVYRGSALPQWQGKYLFGDWSTGFQVPNGGLYLASPPASGQGLWPFTEVMLAGRPQGRLGEYLLSFGQDAANELYVMTYTTGAPRGNTGKVYKLVPR